MFNSCSRMWVLLVKPAVHGVVIVMFHLLQNGFGVNFGCELHINCGSLSPKDCSSRNATYEGESAENPLCNGSVTSFEEVVFSLILCRPVLHP